MGKARDGSECYTRQNKSGGNYVTCEGSQQKRAARQKLKAGGTPPVMTKKPKPVISQRPPGRIETGPLNPGTVVTDFDASAIVHEAPGVVGMTAGMFSGTPIQQRGFYKEDIMSMLGIMNERNKQREQEIAVKKASFKISARDMRDLKFRWELWWRKHGGLGLRDYMKMPTRIATAAFTSQKQIDDTEEREKIFGILEYAIGEGNTYDGTTWKTITKRDIKRYMDKYYD